MATDPNWLTTSQAATALGISQRTIRRQCRDGELPSKRVGGAWRVAASAVKADTERPSETAITDNTARGAATTSNAEAAKPDTVRPNRSEEADNTAKTDTGAATSANVEIISDLRDQVAFLRASVEQHQRSEAELRAALREALRAMPKQLTTGAPESQPGGQGETPTPETGQHPTPEPEARQRPANRDGRALTYSDIADELERNLKP
jgi:excisionase family DNA binding protein